MKKVIFLIKLILSYLRWRLPSFFCKKQPKGIAIIRLDAIGDAIIWLDSAQYYRKLFPNKKLTLFCNSSWQELAEQLPYFDEVQTIDIRALTWKNRLHLSKTLGTHKFEKAILPHYSRDYVLDWIFHQISAEEKIIFDGDYQNNLGMVLPAFKKPAKLNNWIKKISNKRFQIKIKADTSSKMELLRNAEFIQKLGFPAMLPALPQLPFSPSEFNSKLQNYVVFFMGASTLKRAWSVEKFAQIADHFAQKTIVCCGSLQEKNLVKHFKTLTQRSNILDLCGATSILDLLSIIQKAEVIITNETSASHIAVAVKTPCICLIGGGHFGRFQPYPQDLYTNQEKKGIMPRLIFQKMDCYNCDWNCKYPLQNGRWKCIDEISVESVLHELSQV